MTLTLVGRRPPLSLVAAAAPTTAEDFYDETIIAAGPLALALHDGDPEQAADAVTRTYTRVWRAGTPDRTSLLASLVTDARTQQPARGGVVVPLPRHSPSAISPPPVPA